MHRLQIRQTVHNYRVLLPFLQVTSGSVQWCGNAATDRQTDRQTQTVVITMIIERELEAILGNLPKISVYTGLL